MSVREKKNQKRGFVVALIFNGILVSLLMLPIVQKMNKDDVSVEIASINQEEKIYTELPTNFEIEKEHKPIAQPINPRAAKIDPTPALAPKPSPQEESKEVVTTENSDAPIATPKTTNTSESITSTPANPVTVPKPVFHPSTNTTDKSDNTVNTAANTTVWSNDVGNGAFSRSVKYRDPRIKRLSKQHGTIVIRLAVDPYGRVIGTKYQKQLSSLKHDKLAKAVMHYLKNYKFSADYKSMKNQYCDFTITFDLDAQLRTKIK